MIIAKLDPLDRPLRGHKQIAEFTGESLQAVRYKLSKKILRAWKVGGVWYSTPRALTAQLTGQQTAA
jgi:hypothetical protein